MPSTYASVAPGTVSPLRDVPPSIPRPDYVGKAAPAPFTGPEVKDAETIERMRVAGRIAADAMAAAAAVIAPGVTTDEIDRVGHEYLMDHRAYPSTLGYRGFPKSLCTSVNEVVCHGIPDDRPLVDGDIVNLDVTIFLDGVHGDTNATFPVGQIDDASANLIQVTRECLDRGIAAVEPGRQVRQIGRAIQSHAEAQGYGVVRAFVGHGIAEQFHTDLQIPHYDDERADTVIEPGMTFTIEPMITMGAWQHEIWPDDWTAVTVDRKRTAQFEHTLLVTDDGAEILTRTD